MKPNKDHDPAQPHFTFEQAVNWIEEKKKTLKDDVQKEANQQQLSVAPRKDRYRYLTYCVSLLDRIDSDLILRLPSQVRTLYSNKELVEFFKALLGMRVVGYSHSRIAMEFGVPSLVVRNLEIIAQEAVKRRLHQLNSRGIPLVGGE